MKRKRITFVVEAIGEQVNASISFNDNSFGTDDYKEINIPGIKDVVVEAQTYDKIQLSLEITGDLTVERLDNGVQILYQYMTEYAIPKIKFFMSILKKPKYRVAIEKAYADSLSDIRKIEIRKFKALSTGEIEESNHNVKSILNGDTYILDNGDIIPFTVLGEFYTQDRMSFEYFSHDREYPSDTTVITLLREAMKEKNDKFFRINRAVPLTTIDLFQINSTDSDKSREE